MSCILVIQELIAAENSMKTAAHTGTTSFNKSGTERGKKCTKIMDYYKIMIPIFQVLLILLHTHTKGRHTTISTYKIIDMKRSLLSNMDNP